MSKHEKENEVLVMEKPPSRKLLHPHIDLLHEKDNIEKHIKAFPKLELEIGEMAKDNYQQPRYNPSNGMTAEERYCRNLCSQIVTTVQDIETISEKVDETIKREKIVFKKFMQDSERRNKRMRILDAEIERLLA